jgi:hypothetical protein
MGAVSYVIMSAGLICALTFSAYSILWPRKIWSLAQRSLSKEAEPSAAGLSTIRFQGAIVGIIAIVVFLIIIFSDMSSGMPAVPQ